MRRPHRSIEVFDISLMAVVTKAMGAFLVLMLLLMPYYSSGPIGQKAAEDLAKKVEEVNKNIKAVMQDLATASAEDLRKKLEEALKQLEEARKLLVEVQRANDALNAQVARLEDEKKQLAAQIAQLQQRVDALAARVAPLENENAALKEQLAKERSAEISGQLVNSDCLDVGFILGVWDFGSYRVLPNKSRSKYVLNLGSLGSSVSYVDADILKASPLQKVFRPGEGARFNSAYFSFRGAPDGKYLLVAAARGTGPENKDGSDTLKKPSNNCAIFVSYQLRTPEGRYFTVPPYEFRFSKGLYAMAVQELTVSDKAFNSNAVSPEYRAWLDDQIEHADKEP